MSSPRVLVVLGTNAGWSRGVLRGFVATAHERGWTLLHYHPPADPDWLKEEWNPHAAVVGPELDERAIGKFSPAALVSVTVDRSANGIASVCLEEERIATLAAEHLLSTGLRQVSTFRYDESPFAVERERAFVERALSSGAMVAPGWGAGSLHPNERHEHPAALVAWLRGLPRPCGIFTCTDGWGRAVARYARAAGLRVPEDLALIGADNDELECELIAPPLSSVVVPWQELGRRAAALVQRALSGAAIAGEREVVAPVGVFARRSTEVLAIDDELVAKAVRWIHANADRRLTVPAVAKAVASGRQRLERRFRAVLDRTVQEEIRRAHVEAARRLLVTTRLSIAEVARRSGFTNAALLSVAFQREIGTPPSAYRRRAREASSAGTQGDRGGSNQLESVRR
jgi:LacI family transcriptional regulator